MDIIHNVSYHFIDDIFVEYNANVFSNEANIYYLSNDVLMIKTSLNTSIIKSDFFIEVKS